MAEFRKIPVSDFECAPIRMIAKDWLLFTASKPDGTFNPMTVSWGGIGELWGKNVAFVFVRPQRYTHEFTEAGDMATLTWFEEKYRETLAFCGAKSGRDVDKIAESGLTPQNDGDNAIYYSEAKVVFKLKKLYANKKAFTPNNATDPSLFDFHYKKKDYHTLYVYEILEILDRD